MIVKIALLLIGALMLYSPSYSQAMTHQERFEQDYKLTVIKLKYSHFPGPLANEMAKVALARQVLEDGPNRHPNESIAGISTGSWNKEIVDSCVPKHIKIDTINDSTGARFYHFKGFQSTLYSALVVSKLFDFYVNKFLKTERKDWFLCKETSKAISQTPDSFELNFFFYNKLNPIKIIEKCNRLYGPQSESVTNIYKAMK